MNPPRVPLISPGGLLIIGLELALAPAKKSEVVSEKKGEGFFMSFGAKILRITQGRSIEAGPGVRGTPLVTREMGAQHISTGLAEFEDKAEIALHYHNCEEQIIIIEGNATAEIDGVYYSLTTFDSVFSPAGIPHRIMNRSGGGMKFLWIYGSTDVKRTLVNTGETADFCQLMIALLLPKKNNNFGRHLFLIRMVQKGRKVSI
jgi:putative monooxygenase